MLLSNNKKILIYGFDKDEESLIREIINENALPECSVMDKFMAKMKIRDIIDGLNLQVIHNQLPDEKVMLFNNLSDEEIDRAIKAVRSKLKERPILAVVTPTSMEWTLETLINHLIEEREWYKQQRK